MTPLYKKHKHTKLSEQTKYNTLEYRDMDKFSDVSETYLVLK